MEEKGSYCPSCGKFVGALEKCPYCGAEIKKRLSIRLTKILSICVSIVGLAAIYFMARVKEVDLIKIKDIDIGMNFATVRVRGTVIRHPFIKQGYISFLLDDGTGEIRVRAYGDIAERLHVPREGDYVEVTGVIQIKAGEPVILLNAIDRLKFLNKRYTEIGEINEKYLGKVVWVRGWVKDVWDIKKGKIFVLADGKTPENTIKCVIFNPHFVIFPGQKVECYGRIKEYRGELELVIYGDINYLSR